MNKVLVQEGILRHDFITGKGKYYNVYRGVKSLEAGYIYAPYIPTQITEPIGYNDYQQRQNILSRYATTTVNNRYYSTITMSDFNSLSNG